MMWRKVVLVVVVGLLVSGLVGVALAEKPPTRGGPGPRPWQWGDPDWPSHSRDFSIIRRPAVEDTGATAEPPSMCHVQEKHRAPSRLCKVRVLGVTIVIWR